MTLADAGRWAFGVVYLEAWVATVGTRTQLVRPGCGWWVDPSFRLSHPSIDRLFDDSAEDGFPLEPVAPGVGLLGALWSELHSVPERRSGSGRIATALHRASHSVFHRPRDDDVCWRNVHALACDSPRLRHASDLGLGWAAGASFASGGGGIRGIVVYYARGTADRTKLSSRDNEEYLRQAARVVGAAYALRRPRRVVVRARKREVDAVLRRVRYKILALLALGVKLETLAERNAKRHSSRRSLFSLSSFSSVDSFPKLRESFSAKAEALVRKARGAGVPPPPTFAWDQTAWTFTGTFTTMMVLTLLSDVTKEEWDEPIPLAPLGALVTLQYALTAAPACQPPNIVLGQALSLIIAQVIGTATAWAPWFKITLATSLAITLMVKTGLTHPPAGAAAVLFSSGKCSWSMVGVVLLSNLVAISTSTLINNLSEKRQYPTFWGLRPLLDFFDERLLFRPFQSHLKKSESGMLTLATTTSVSSYGSS